MMINVPTWAVDQFTPKTVEVNGFDIPYLVGGDGPPVMMIHGLSGSFRWWRYNAPAIARHLRVYLLDLPGFGVLGGFDACDSMSAYVDWLQSWMAAVGLDRAHVIGHSMGGHIGLRLAAEYPDSVDRLVLVAPAGALPYREIPRYAIPLIRFLRSLPPVLRPDVLRDVLRANPRTVWRSTHSLIEHDVLDILEHVHVPTLVIWGEDDPIIPLSFARRFEGMLPNAELTVIDGAGHIAMADNPARFNQHVIAFLSGAVSDQATNAVER